MATKSITITTEAYDRLAAHKERHESFSDVVNKLAGSHSLVDLVGLLSDKEAKEFKKHRKELNTRMRNEIDRRAKRFL